MAEEERKRPPKGGNVSRNNSSCQNYTQENTRQNHPQDATTRQNHTQGATNPASLPVQDYVWSDQIQTLRDFVSKHKLPAVARLLKNAGDLPHDFLSPSRSQHPPQSQQQSGPLDVLAAQSQPQPQPHQESVIQIHELGKRRVVLARRVQWEKRQNDYVVSGEQVDIPAPFKGWFEAASEDGRAVEYCDAVGALCGDKPRQFLVRASTVAYRLSVEDQGGSCWMPHEIQAGKVLTTGTVYDHMPNIRNSNNRTSRATEGSKKGKRSRSVSPGRGFLRRLLKPSKSRQKAEQEYKYLQCFDADGQEITIPLATSEIFSPVGDPTLASYDAVYQLQDLILAFGLPVNARLIHSSPEEKNVCPQGVLRLYGTREEEMAVVSRMEPGKDGLGWDASESVKVEVSLDRNLQLQLGRSKRQIAEQRDNSAPKTSPEAGDVSSHKGGDRHEAPSQDELPKCVSKELKKFKSTGILDKLSVRAMRKERTKTRENAPSNSKQVAQHDLCYEDFFRGLGRSDPQKETKAHRSSVCEGRSEQSSEMTQVIFFQESPHESSGSNDTNSSTNGARKISLQNRGLPPIPRLAPPAPSGPCGSTKGSKDSLYDHLPPAPSPPTHRSISEPTHLKSKDDLNHLLHYDDDDGYMVPSDLPGADPTASSANADVHMRHNSPQVSHRSGKTSRLKKCRSELFPPDLHSGVISTDDGWQLDIDKLFSSTYSKKSQTLYGCVSKATAWTGSSSQLYDVHAKKAQASEAAVTAWRDDVQRHQDNAAYLGGPSALDHQSVEKLDLETRATTGRRGKRPTSHHINTNATLRSHNLRQPKATLLELFHFGDSFKDEANPNAGPFPSAAPVSAGSSSSSVQNASKPPPFPSMSVARIGERRRESNYGEAVTSPSCVFPTAKGESLETRSRPHHYSTYAESEPLFQALYPHHTPSLSAFSDSAYPKQGDDSAISVGSRGDRDNPYGFTNGSDLSFHYDSGSGGTLTSLEECWSPPDDISALSVHEVSRSLRYIGMKDRVVLRFANEQIDGNMLSSLDKRLLKEGFPELNALEVKKILDFVHGWRPKKK